MDEEHLKNNKNISKWNFELNTRVNEFWWLKSKTILLLTVCL